MGQDDHSLMAETPVTYKYPWTMHDQHTGSNLYIWWELNGAGKILPRAAQELDMPLWNNIRKHQPSPV
jgi:hypothetical protein